MQAGCDTSDKSDSGITSVLSVAAGEIAWNELLIPK